MSDANDMPHRAFVAPRIPFDLRCVTLAAAGYLVLALLDAGLGQLFKTASPLAQMFDLVGREIGRVAFLGEGFQLAMRAVWGVEEYALEWWQALVVALLFFTVWGIFGGALMRTSAMRLTRDAPVPIRESLAFSGKHLISFLAVPGCIVLFAGFFILCNVAAGAVMSIWGIGSSVLSLILFPLVLLSSLLILLSVLGGIVGLPLMWAGIAVERHGALEALSGAFSYIFARKFQFFFSYLMIFVLMSVVMLIGSYFEDTVKCSVRAGAWREDFNRMISEPPGELDVLEDDYRKAKGPQERAEGIAHLPNVARARWYDWLGFVWMWLTLGIFLLGFKGYALYILLGGSVWLFLQLRLEVDGVPEEEIQPPLDEDEQAPGAYVPRWVGSEAEQSDAADDSPATELPGEIESDPGEEPGQPT